MKNLQAILDMTVREMRLYGRRLDRRIVELHQEAVRMLRRMNPRQKYRFWRIFCLERCDSLRRAMQLVGGEALRLILESLRGVQNDMVVLRATYYNGGPVGRA